MNNVTLLFVLNAVIPRNIELRCCRYFKYLDRKTKALHADLEELGKRIHPEYQEIFILVQKADLKRNSKHLITALKNGKLNGTEK